MTSLNKFYSPFFVLTALVSFPLMASESSSSDLSMLPQHKVFDPPRSELLSEKSFSETKKIMEEQNPLVEKVDLKQLSLSESSSEKEITADFKMNERFAPSSLPNDLFRVSPVDYSHLISFSVLPPKKEIIRRGGIELPSIDSRKIGLNKFFEKYGVNIGFGSQYFFHNSFSSDMDEILFRLKIPFLNEVSNPLFALNLENLLSKEIDQLSEEEVILLFRRATYIKAINGNVNPADLKRKLEKLLADERSRNIILQKSSQNSEKESEDYILKAIQHESSFLGKHLTKLLFSYPEFACHLRKSPEAQKLFERFSSFVWLLNDPDLFSVFKGLVEDETSRNRILMASSEGEKDLVLKAMKNFALFRKDRALAVLFSQEEFFSHLSEKRDKDGNDEIMTSLLCAIQLNSDDVVSTFFKIPNVFRHLLSHKGDDIVLNVYVNAGLLMSLSSRSSKDIKDLFHDDLVRFLGEDSRLLRKVISNALEERNNLLILSLLKSPDLTLLPEEILNSVRIPTVWSLLDQSQKPLLFDKIKTIKPDFTVEDLEEEHKYVTAVEHVRTSHPQLAEDMKKYSPQLAEEYQATLLEIMKLDLVSDEDRKLKLLSLKYNLESRFLKELRGASKAYFPVTPWDQTFANSAYDQEFFGQTVKSLVVELEELPLNQKEGLLKSHLGSKTLFKGGVQGGRSNHNIGVTSLVTKMAPLSKVDSTISSKLSAFEGEILSGEYPFINCSWGPTDDLGKDKKISIFSSHQFLNDLLGNDKVVLIKSAGNDSTCLSNPCMNDDPSGICFARLLDRLKEQSFSNLILAINLTPSNTIAKSSNTPGNKDTLKRNSLCAQGCQTFWLDETGHDYRPLADGGTSSAAPIITGAAALLKSYKPQFTPILIKNCLMHSASRDFYIFDDEGKPVSYVCEKEAKIEDPSLSSSNYSFEKYGMGLLNVERAFRYADVLENYLETRKGNQNDISFEEYEELRNRG